MIKLAIATEDGEKFFNGHFGILPYTMYMRSVRVDIRRLRGLRTPHQRKRCTVIPTRQEESESL